MQAQLKRVKAMKKLFLVAIAVYLVWLLFLKEQEVSYGPGVLAPAAPYQERSAKTSFQMKGFTITSLADFSLKAKVLSREDYNRGRESELAPTDLALGWGRMSDEAVIDKLSISQSGRWYRWSAREFPIPRREIELSSANMHIIPKDDTVEYFLKQVRKGDIVSMSGSLVRVDASDGWHWVSSLTRSDTGGGACEIFLVDYLSIETIN